MNTTASDEEIVRRALRYYAASDRTQTYNALVALDRLTATGLRDALRALIEKEGE